MGRTRQVKKEEDGIWQDKTRYDLHWPYLTWLDMPCLLLQWPHLTWPDLTWPDVTLWHDLTWLQCIWCRNMTRLELGQVMSKGHVRSSQVRSGHVKGSGQVKSGQVGSGGVIVSEDKAYQFKLYMANASHIMSCPVISHLLLLSWPVLSCPIRLRVDWTDLVRTVVTKNSPGVRAWVRITVWVWSLVIRILYSISLPRTAQ